MDDNASSALIQLRSRLQEAASLLGTPARTPPLPDSTDAPWTQVLVEVDGLLAQASALVKSLDRESDTWDGLDHLLGRIVLRDIAEAARRLRALLADVDSQLTRIDSQVRPLVRALQDPAQPIHRDSPPAEPLNRQ